MSMHALRLALLLGALTAAPAPAAEPTANPGGSIPYELWDRPRSGRAVLAVAAVRAAITALSTDPATRFRIVHPAGVDGMLQAEELRTWLIAHAIEPERIALQAGPAGREPLRLEIVSRTSSSDRATDRH